MLLPFICLFFFPLKPWEYIIDHPMLAEVVGKSPGYLHRLEFQPLNKETIGTNSTKECLLLLGKTQPRNAFYYLAKLIQGMPDSITWLD